MSSRAIACAALLGMAAASGAALSQEPPPARAKPQAFVEAATLGGAGNALVVSRVPVQTATGKIKYYDVTLQFSVNAAGALTAGEPTIKASPILLTGDFVAGRYRNGENIYVLSGPGIGDGGRTTWSLRSNTCARFDAGWTSGPVKGHPSQTDLEKLGISYGGLSYGAGGGDNGCLTSQFWGDGTLISASGGPNGLTLFSYTERGNHFGSPQQSASFDRCKNAACN